MQNSYGIAVPTPLRWQTCEAPSSLLLIFRLSPQPRHCVQKLIRFGSFPPLLCGCAIRLKYGWVEFLFVFSSRVPSPVLLSELYL